LANPEILVIIEMVQAMLVIETGRVRWRWYYISDRYLGLHHILRR